MKVSQLKQLIDAFDGDTEVVVTAGDHGYRKAKATWEEAEKTSNGALYEYFDDMNMGLGSQKLNVLLIN
jgi:hypothetical protein